MQISYLPLLIYVLGGHIGKGDEQVLVSFMHKGMTWKVKTPCFEVQILVVFTFYGPL